MRTLLMMTPMMLIVACGGEPVTVATGELEAWSAGPELPTPRANHCIAVIDDTVLVIGGNYKAGADFVKTNEVHAARMTNGVLGAWQLAGTMPSPVTECTATSDGRRLYVLDGLYDEESDGCQVFTATLDEAGKLSPMTAMTQLPQIAISSEATVKDGVLLMMDTVLPADGDRTITLRTSVTGGDWSEDDWQIGFRAQAQYAFADAGFAYTIGGYSGAEGNPVSDEVFVADLGTGGIGVGRPTTKLPAPVSFGEAIAVDDFVFVVGGRAQVFGGEPSTAVYAAPVLTDGALGEWATLAPLPMARTNHELALVGDHLVIAGGAAGGAGDANVLVARVRF